MSDENQQTQEQQVEAPAAADKKVVLGAWLFKRGKAKSSEYKKRYFTLFDDGTLEYAEKEGDQPKGVIALREALTVPGLVKESDTKYVIRVALADREYKLYSPDEEHAKKWHSVIVAAAINLDWLKAALNGVELTKIHATSKGSATKTVKISGSSLAGAYSKDVPLLGLTKITVGKETEVLKKEHNVDLVAEQLFSLHLEDRTVDFDAGSKDTVDKWARNLPLVQTFMASQEARGQKFRFKKKVGKDFLTRVIDPVVEANPIVPEPETQEPAADKEDNDAGADK